MPTLIAVFAMIRPINATMAATMALISYIVVADYQIDFLITAQLMAACVFTVAAQSIFNDVVDIDVDRRQKPHKPLPAEKVSINLASVLSFFLTVLAILCALMINWQAAVFIAVANAGTAFYSVWAKRRCGVVGTVLCSLLIASICFMGPLIVGNWNLVWTMAATVFFATLAREIVKDIEDLPGDLGIKQHTLPMLLQPRYAMTVAISALAAQVMTSYLPVLVQLLSWRYAVAVTLVNMVVLGVALQPKYREPRGAPRLQRILKVTMCLYLGAYLLG